jgi:putative IMPACT (imprinted ancient) family translation regulator
MRLKEEFRKETVINRSRFIACVAPVFSEEEALTVPPQRETSSE